MDNNQFNKDLDDDQIRTVYSRTLGGANGETIKKDLRYYVERVSHTPGDPLTTAFKEGERSLALRILQLAEVIC